MLDNNDWGNEVAEQITEAAMREKERGYGFTFGLLQETEGGRKWLKKAEEKIKEEKKKKRGR